MKKKSETDLLDLIFKGDLMRFVITGIMLVLFLAGCSSYSEEFIISGEVTRVEGDLVSIDNQEIKVDDPSDFKVGQKVKVTLIDHTSEEDWDPDDFEVKKVTFMK
ncbi:hypothetical protein [Thalassobacillus hwangdonensis]|uniref:DUF3221 domain-containing protein n=1 Tax=Thalassobacillus hwangdonensis TaxID=546108 RepID=A0ABW3L3J7_9BACI